MLAAVCDRVRRVPDHCSPLRACRPCADHPFLLSAVLLSASMSKLIVLAAVLLLAIAASGSTAVQAAKPGQTQQSSSRADVTLESQRR